jgi:hypothetical protein
MRAFGHVHVACQGQMVEGDAGTPGDSCGCLRVVMEGFTKVRACLALTANGQTSPQWYVASSIQPVRLPRYRIYGNETPTRTRGFTLRANAVDVRVAFAVYDLQCDLAGHAKRTWRRNLTG